jgi:type IV fimbrial biogenesis protein FimT
MDGVHHLLDHQEGRHMLRQDTRGFSLIELMVVVAIASVLFALAAPSFSTWIQNTRIRNTAQDIYTGIQRAKAEAVQRNIQARFQLTTDLSSSCALSTSGTAWVINQIDPTSAVVNAAGKCNLAIDTAGTTPRLLATRPPETGNSKVVVTSTNTDFVFNSLGKQVNPPATDITITVSASTGTCGTYSATGPTGGNLSCLRIVISPAGQTRMCNPRFASTDPQGC